MKYVVRECEMRDSEFVKVVETREYQTREAAMLFVESYNRGATHLNAKGFSRFAICYYGDLKI